MTTSRYTTKTEWTDFTSETTPWFQCKLIKRLDQGFAPAGTVLNFHMQRITTPEGIETRVRVFNGRSERILDIEKAKTHLKTLRDRKGDPLPSENLEELTREYTYMFTC